MHIFRLTSLCIILALFMPGLGRALTVVTEQSPPAVLVVDGKPAGVGVEIVREIQRRAGDGSPIEVLPWARAYAMAQEMPDVVIFCISRTEEREDLFEWVGPIFRIEWLFVGIEGKAPRLASLADARGVRAIGTYKDDAREEYLLSRGFTNLDSAPDPYTNIRKLLSGRVDLIVTTSMGFEVMKAMDDARQAPLGKVFAFNTMDLYVAFSKGSDPVTVDAWRKAFAGMRADGTTRAIYARFLPGESPPE